MILIVLSSDVFCSCVLLWLVFPLRALDKAVLLMVKCRRYTHHKRKRGILRVYFCLHCVYFWYSPFYLLITIINCIWLSYLFVPFIQYISPNAGHDKRLHIVLFFLVFFFLCYFLSSERPTQSHISEENTPISTPHKIPTRL